MLKRIVKYIIFTLLVLLLSLVTLGYALLNSSGFQNYISSKATVWLSAQFNTNISIGSITYNPFSSFSLTNVYFGDQKNDTLFYAGKVTFNVGHVNTDSLFFELRNVKVEQGLCKIAFYKDGVFNMDVILDYVRKDTTHSSGPKFHLLLADVVCTNTRFIMDNFSKPYEPKGFDPYHEMFGNIRLEAHDFHIVEDSLNFQLTHLESTERSGLRVNHLAQHTIITNKGMYFSHLDIRTPYSKIADKGNVFNLHYRDYGQLPEFIDSIRMTASLRNGHIDMRDIAFFAPVLEGQRQQFDLRADFSGTVADFVVKNLVVNYGKGSKFIGKVSMTGMPDYENTFVDAQVTEAISNTDDIGYVAGFAMPKQMQQLGTMKFKGDFSGFFADFVAYGDFETALGNAHSDINMKFPEDVMAAEYSGQLQLKGFDLGKLLGEEKYLGATSLELNVKGSGFEPNKLQAEIDADISSFHANRYTYHNISLQGKIDQKMFNGEMEVNDTNIELSFGGLIDFNREIPLYQFKSQIHRAFLQPLNFDSSATILSANIDINFSARDLDHHKGEIKVTDINCIKEGRDYRIKNVMLKSDIRGTRRDIQLTSDDVDAGLSGEVTMTALGNALHQITAVLFPAYIKAVPADQLPLEQLNYAVKVRNTQIINALFPFPYAISGLEMDGTMNLANNSLIMTLTAEQIGYGDYKLKELQGELTTAQKIGNFKLQANEVLQFDTLFMRGFSLTADAQTNRMQLGLFENDSISHIRSDCRSTVLFTAEGIRVTIDTSVFEYRQFPFTIHANSTLLANDAQIDFQHVVVSSNSQQVNISGFYAFDGNHQLRADLNNIDMSIINTIDRTSKVRYGGMANGAMVLKGSGGVNYIDAYLNVTSLKLDQDKIGDFSITSNYNEKQKRFMIYAKSLNGKLRNLEFGGYIETAVKPYAINMSVAFDESPLNSFQAFLKDQLFIYEGTASAQCKLTGTLDDMSLNGQIYLNKVRSRVEYLKTIYSFETTLYLDKNKMIIRPTKLVDVNGRAATFEGVVSHRSFSDFNLDIKLRDMKKFKVLNTTVSDNSMYYGTGYASGDLQIHGPIRDIVMDARIKTEAGTQFFIPLQSSTNAENELMHFINTDTVSRVQEMNTITKLYGFSMNIMLEVTPDAEIQIIMDAINDDKIRGTGKGTLKMELTRQGQFNMYGGVTIEEGDYNFTAAKLWTRKFIFKKGGTILWAGDPLMAILDITGVYKARKTSIADFLLNIDETQYNIAKSQRVPVECMMYLKGNMMSPEFKFDLNFPDISSNLSAENVTLENSLTTYRNNPDMMNQQVVSLLAFNNFVAINSASSANRNFNSGVSNTLSDLMTKSINKGVGKLIPGLDFNIDMQYSNQQRPQYILSASKKLFSDRLDLQMSYDVINYNQNFMTQYNIRKDGSLRLRAYQKTSTSTDPTYYKNITTQGLGLYYRKEFDQFSDLFKRKPYANNVKPSTP